MPIDLMRYVRDLDIWLIGIFCAATAVISVVPILRYLARPWALRREHLCYLLSGPAIVAYYDNFRPSCIAGREHDKDLEKELLAEFRSGFDFWHGNHFYNVPICVLSTLAGISAFWSVFNLHDLINGTRKLDSMYTLVQSALGGAFVWIISDEVNRLRRRDFTPSDVYYYAFRILFSIPFGWALTGIDMPRKIAVPIAFFLGTFPTTTLFTFARRFVSEKLKLGDSPEGTIELQQLQSIGRDNAERFKDEGISTISNLACADPVVLTISTNFDFPYVIECMSQAILWLYIAPTDDLNRLGLRGAKEVSDLVAVMNDPAHPEARATVSAAAVLLNIPVEALKHTLMQISDDSRTAFLRRVTP